MDFPFMVTLILYFSLLFVMGAVASRRMNNLSDFVLGGRSLSGAIAALGAGASDMSGWLLLGLPGAVYTGGISAIWLPIGLSLGAFFNWLLVARRLRVYTEVANDSLTIPAYFDNRFHDTSETLRVVTAVTILVFFTLYAAAGFVGGGLLFQTMFGLSYHQSVCFGAVILIIYLCLGGFLAVNWADFFQGSLMFFALLIVPIVAFTELGGAQPVFSTIRSININFVDAFAGISLMGTISLLAWGLGYFGQPHILVRFMAVKTERAIPQARFICMTWMIFSLYGAIFVGFLGIPFFADQPLADPETVFLKLVEILFNPWIGGFLLAAVLSAIMSTIAAQLLASSSALTEDLYHILFRRNASQRELVIVGRLSIVAVALVSLMFAFNPESTILNLVGYAWAGLGAAFGPVMLCSLFWSRLTRRGAITGVIVGGLVVIAWKQLSVMYGGIFELYEIIPGFFASLLSIVLVSLLDKPPAASVKEEFFHVLKRCSG